MRGVVKNNGRVAGYIERIEGKHIFTYDDDYFNDPTAFAISLTIPKNERKHVSEKLHPFFQGMLAEGANKTIQCQAFSISENDDFIRLVKTAKNTIGAITVEEAS